MFQAKGYDRESDLVDLDDNDMIALHIEGEDKHTILRAGILDPRTGPQKLQPLASRPCKHAIINIINNARIDSKPKRR